MAFPTPIFHSVELDVPVRGRTCRVVVEADLLKCLWSAFEGPQTSAWLAYANRDLFRTMAEAHFEDPIRLTSIDWEG